jgi:hypothetical protein
VIPFIEDEIVPEITLTFGLNFKRRCVAVAMMNAIVQLAIFETETYGCVCGFIPFTPIKGQASVSGIESTNRLVCRPSTPSIVIRKDSRRCSSYHHSLPSEYQQFW